MKKLIVIALLLIIGLFASMPTMVLAQRVRRVNIQQVRQQMRIQNGVRSGAITRPEARRLEAGEARIETEKRIDNVTGGITPAQRLQLNRELSHESQMIYRMKHNNRVQP